ncbi:MAG: tetratricopeptide repeat protein [Deltaproteobacteria bacterium]|nr:tetratricopeptide repeat protein [Deltaproteobacteria bacterium]
MKGFLQKRSSGEEKKPREEIWREKNNELVGLLNAGKIQEALDRGKEMVEFVDRKFKGDAREKATTYNNMGMVFMLQRDYDLAEQCFHDALNMRKRILGDVHNEVAVIYLNLVELYRRQAQEILAANPVKTD